MERLTRKLFGRYSAKEGYELDTLKGARAVMSRLAAYEDSGLTPKEVMELAKIVRCKDCKYHSYDEEYGNHWCNYQHGAFLVEQYGFCNRGEGNEQV